MSKLQAFLDHALIEKSKRDSAHLGNRSDYVGASDVCGCPRKAVLSKQCPVRHDSATLLKFARGHAAEQLLDEVFRSGGLNPLREVEIRHPEFSDLLCHIDYLFIGKNGRRHVVELKTVDGLPESPYDSWVHQLHFQMGLLALEVPGVEIGGSILALDLNKGTYQEFNGYRPDPITFELLVAKGQRIKSCLDTDAAPDVEPGLLCGFCSYRSDCPAFREGAGEIPEEVRLLAQRYLAAHQQKKAAEKQLDGLKGNLLAFTGKRFKGTSAGEEPVFLNAFEVGPSETVDSEALKTNYPEIYAQVKKPRAGYVRLEVKAA